MKNIQITGKPSSETLSHVPVSAAVSGALDFQERILSQESGLELYGCGIADCHPIGGGYANYSTAKQYTA